MTSFKELNMLPDDLVVKLVQLLNKKRRLDDSNIIRFLRPQMQILDLANCQNVKNVSMVS